MGNENRNPSFLSNRSYQHEIDYERVGRFLQETYATAGEHINWLQPRWEYMHFHPYIRKVDLSRIGIWEYRGDIVAVVHPEHFLGSAYFELAPEFHSLKEEMLNYAETHISFVQDDGRRLRLFINDSDLEFQQLARQRGYVKTEWQDPMAQFVIPHPFPNIQLPGGFKLQSLADENDLQQVDRVLWRGFDHGDEPPEGGIPDREFMQSAPNFRKALNIAAVAPDGNYVAYAGLWFEPVNAIAYVEPVATDPSYRRMGLGRAAVLEGIRRCGEQGAQIAYVGSTMPFYQSMGFRLLYQSTVWQRSWTE